MKGARNYTGTLYLLLQTLVIPSLITESKYHIQRYKNKTNTVVMENGLELSIRGKIVGLCLQDMDSMVGTALTIEKEIEDARGI